MIPSQVRIEWQGEQRNLQNVCWEIMGGRPCGPGDSLKKHATQWSKEGVVEDFRVANMFIGEHRGWPLWEFVGGGLQCFIGYIPWCIGMKPPVICVDSNNPGRIFVWTGAGKDVRAPAQGIKVWIKGLRYPAYSVTHDPLPGQPQWVAVSCGGGGVVLVDSGSARAFLHRDGKVTEASVGKRHGFLEVDAGFDDLDLKDPCGYDADLLCGSAWKEVVSGLFPMAPRTDRSAPVPKHFILGIEEGKRSKQTEEKLAAARSMSEGSARMHEIRILMGLPKELTQTHFAPHAVDRHNHSAPDPVSSREASVIPRVAEAGQVVDAKGATERREGHKCTRMCDGHGRGKFGHAPDFLDAWHVQRWIKGQQKTYNREFTKEQREFLGLDGVFNLAKAQELCKRVTGVRKSPDAPSEPAKPRGEHRHTRLCDPASGVCAPAFRNVGEVAIWTSKWKRDATWWQLESLGWGGFDLERAQALWQEDRRVGREDPRTPAPALEPPKTPRKARKSADPQETPGTPLSNPAFVGVPPETVAKVKRNLFRERYMSSQRIDKAIREMRTEDAVKEIADAHFRIQELEETELRAVLAAQEARRAPKAR